MKLADLNAQFYGATGRSGIGILLDCPCGCENLLGVPFTNPIDGGPPENERVTWQRTGETIETLTLTPSIRRVPIDGFGCAWHGWITNGEVTSC